MTTSAAAAIRPRSIRRMNAGRRRIWSDSTDSMSCAWTSMPCMRPVGVCFTSTSPTPVMPKSTIWSANARTSKESPNTSPAEIVVADCGRAK